MPDGETIREAIMVRAGVVRLGPTIKGGK